MNFSRVQARANLLWRLNTRHVRLRVRVAVWFSITLLWAVFAAAAAYEYGEVWQKAYLNASSAGRLISLDLARNLEILELDLHGLEDALSFPGLSGLPLKQRNQVLYDPAASADFFANVFVMDEHGDLVVDSRTLTPSPINYADREYFKFLRDHASQEMYINQPVLSKVGDGWTVPVAVRRTHPDGSFAGVMVGGLRLNYLRRLFQQASTDTGDTISLVRDDGVVLERWPTVTETADTRIEYATPLELARQPGQHWTKSTSQIDGITRYWTFVQVGKYPLMVRVGISASSLFGAWYWQIGSIGVILLVLSVTVVALTSGLARELDRRIRSERLLLEAAERESTIFRNSADSLFVVRVEHGPAGPTFVCETLSPAFEQLTGLRVEDVVGRRPDECLPPDAAAAIVARFQRCVTERSTIPWQASYRLPVGRRDFEGTVTAVPPSAGGKVVRLVGAMRNVTERRELEAALHHSQKLESIGRLSAGVAHYFNNILQSIVGGLEVILDDVQVGTPAHDVAGVAIKSATRGSFLTNHLLSYARKQLLQPQGIVLRPFLTEVRAYLSRMLGPHITVQASADSSAVVWADPRQLKTALVNLAINAAHAMPQGGVVVLGAQTKHEGEQAEVAITVTDTGSGMDEATLARAVEPFFSTKGLEGSGLGLSMVQGFAEQSSGRLRITSALGKGTTVELYLPLTMPPDQYDLSEIIGGAAEDEAHSFAR